MLDVKFNLLLYILRRENLKSDVFVERQRQSTQWFPRKTGWSKPDFQMRN